jgi:DNA-directed RNA polymerase
MLVDLNKEEINYIVNVLSLNNSEIMNKEETQFSSNLYLKLRNLSTVCTCKEDKS